MFPKILYDMNQKYYNCISAFFGTVKVSKGCMGGDEVTCLKKDGIID